MFNSYRTDIALHIQIKNSVFVEVARFSDWCIAKFNQKGIGIRKVADFHGKNLRSKNAL